MTSDLGVETYQRPTEFVVSAVPVDLCTDWWAWDINVSWRGPGDLWAVLRHSQCLGADGEWDWEPSPSNREDDWKQTHRFSLIDALRLAHEAAPTVVVNGISVSDIIEKYAANLNSAVTSTLMLLTSGALRPESPS